MPGIGGNGTALLPAVVVYFICILVLGGLVSFSCSVYVCECACMFVWVPATVKSGHSL